MCCNTKAGPRAAIKFFKKKTGIHVTQSDWHKIRTAAEVNLGRKLSNKVADSHAAALAAAEFADSLNATADEKKAIIFELSQVRTTESNVDTIKEIATNGLPEAVVNKKSRVSVQQKLATASQAASDMDEDKLVSIVEEGERQNPNDDLFQVNVSYSDGSPDNDFQVWAPNSLHARQYVSSYGSTVLGFDSQQFSVDSIQQVETDSSADVEVEDIANDDDMDEFNEKLDGKKVSRHAKV
jgi:hypothetical protein